MEAFGQRDEATMIALREALAFQTKIGRADIEKRSRALAQQLMAGLSKIDGFKLWTSTTPERSAAVVSFQPGSLDTRKLLAALYEKDRIAVTSRGGTDRPGLRVSPHFYNTMDEVDRLVRALSGYARTSL
jgi:cysteine desulfurase/selenocysteine lyase